MDKGNAYTIDRADIRDRRLMVIVTADCAISKQRSEPNLS